MKNIKTILFLVLTTLFTISCTESDDTGPSEPQPLQIKKLTITRVNENGNPSGSKTEYNFDQNGIFTDKLTVDAMFNDTRRTEYTYNELGQLTQSKEIFLDANSEYRLQLYIYNPDKTLNYITDSFNEENPEINYQFTYDPNRINIEYRSPGFYTQLNYSGNSLTTIDDQYDGGGSFTESISYDINDNIASLSGTSSVESTSSNTYLYDDKINPLYPYFRQHVLNLLGETFFNINSVSLFFSPNNIVSEVATSNFDQNNYSYIRTFQYDEAGYPITAITKRDNVIVSELTYEYY